MARVRYATETGRANDLRSGRQCGDTKRLHRMCDVAHEEAQRGRDVVRIGQARNPDGQIAQRRHDLWCGFLSHLGAVFVENSVAHVVQAVLDRPVPAIEPEQPRAICPLRRKTGDGEDGLGLLDPAALEESTTLEARPLPQIRKVLGVGETLTHPDAARFDAPVSVIGGFQYRGKNPARGAG